MPMNKRAVVVLLSLATCIAALVYSGKTVVDKLESQYYIVLDGWVQRGGQLQEYQKDVLETCEKLVLTSATAWEMMVFATTQREEYEFRTKVCAKTTVHRVHRQSELNDQELVQGICDNIKIPVLEGLCRRSGLR